MSQIVKNFKQLGNEISGLIRTQKIKGTILRRRRNSNKKLKWRYFRSLKLKRELWSFNYLNINECRSVEVRELSSQKWIETI